MAIRGIDIHKWKLCNLMKSGFAMKKWARKDPAAFSDLVVEIHLGRHDTIRQVVSLAAKAFDPLRCVHKAGPGSLAYRDPLLAEIMVSGLAGKMNWNDCLPSKFSGRWPLYPGIKSSGLSCMCLETPPKRHTKR
ncbi:hypothetical protein T4D_3772 [Trichinella pseudospiralis]|uniref:Uncharacterized protein n=1 Tax=Trichinella pseudospiralis TaxID=6337 RepID=A0A0V1FD09_TRIPS|nr:hypothetical protein T4D_3772 [Trichinella pseudospiralis]